MPIGEPVWLGYFLQGIQATIAAALGTQCNDNQAMRGARAVTPGAQGQFVP